MEAKEKISVVDWFDCKNIQHLKAYREICKTGCWPKGFIPPNVEMVNMWQVGIAGKLAMAHCKEKLGAW